MATTDTGVPFSPPLAEEPVDERGWRWNILGRLLRARMANDRETPLTVDLPAQSARSVLVRDLPFTIQCIRGSLWITHPADPGDHTLTSGDSFDASGRGHLVMLAFDPSRVVTARGPAKPA
jgi:hypothetical protein